MKRVLDELIEAGIVSPMLKVDKSTLVLLVQQAVRETLCDKWHWTAWVASHEAKLQTLSLGIVNALCEVKK